MGSASWTGQELRAIGEAQGWVDAGPGGKHPIRMQKTGMRTVPIRAKIQNRNEAQDVLKQMKIPKTHWPENLK